MLESHTHLAFLILTAVALILGGTSCRTMRGAGEDIQHAGSHLERAVIEHDHR
jgi:predicted small secreted protein